MLEMLKEGGVYSINRVFPTINDIVFLGITIYLAITNGRWEHYTFYGEFTAILNGYVLGNKAINSVWNTPKGSMGKPMGDTK